MACRDECYTFSSNAYMSCPAEAPPLTQCASPENVSYVCAGDMVQETFAAACADEAAALSNRN